VVVAHGENLQNFRLSFFLPLWYNGVETDRKEARRVRKRTPALLLALTLLLLCGCGKEEAEPDPSPAETGYTATGWSNPDVPKNEFAQEAFVSVGGFTIYTA